jgi:hypothetical protein
VVTKPKFFRAIQTLRKPSVQPITNGIRCAATRAAWATPHSSQIKYAMLRIAFDKVAGTSHTLNVIQHRAIEIIIFD